jgi:SAM-dependent methyltransferase
MIVGGKLGYNILKHISLDGETGYMDGSAYAEKSKLEALLGKDIWEQIAGKTVIDFGCKSGVEAIEMAQRGAKKVIGVDIWESELAKAKEAAQGIDNCTFTNRTTEQADIVISMDSFEHFDDPADILRIMRGLVNNDGYILLAFGPTWYHPLGGHQFSVFPWAHLLFTEKALIRWRSDFKTDGATNFSEIEGGLNQMTIRRFKKLVSTSPLRIKSFELVPIRALAFMANRLTREFTTALVRCKLIR